MIINEPFPNTNQYFYTSTWNEVGRSEKKYLSLSSKQVEVESILTAGKSFVGVEKCHLQASPHPG